MWNPGQIMVFSKTHSEHSILIDLYFMWSSEMHQSCQICCVSKMKLKRCLNYSENCCFIFQWLRNKGGLWAVDVYMNACLFTYLSSLKLEAWGKKGIKFGAWSSWFSGRQAWFSDQFRLGNIKVILYGSLRISIVWELSLCTDSGWGWESLPWSMDPCQNVAGRGQDLG